MSKSTRRGDAPAPEIVAQARIAAGILAEIFGVDKNDLLDRPRPSGLLRCVRDVLIGVLHHKMGVSQQKIAAALGRDRGVISDAAYAVDEASNGSDAIRFAFAEIHEEIANIMVKAEAWKEALQQQAIDEAITASKISRQVEAEDADELEEEIAVDEFVAVIAKPAARCHQCYGKGRVRIHHLGGDPAYRDAWAAAEKLNPSPSGFHELPCRFCKGAGERLPSPAASASPAILAAVME